MIHKYKHNIKSLIYYNKDRKKIKIYFRRLWITRINAKIRYEGNIYSSYYSLFFKKLRNKNLIFNRKMLGQIAISNPIFFHVIYNFILD
uniref:Large ribosomal subunit protein bL20c n=1 Tax=Epipogium roseum TaxID=556037 RepID=A0A0B4N4T3_9ASPA|nr:ribosomal protein L20 [Epipogium roseum]AII40854.1 ribosomal protein L20 [Epipogium roseum]